MRTRLVVGPMLGLFAAPTAGAADWTQIPEYRTSGEWDGDRSAARRAIEQRGFRILADVGDQRSDLRGGYAERRYRLPNPTHTLP